MDSAQPNNISKASGNNDEPDELRSRQHDVQRKLGRALIRLQQCERFAKFVAAEHDISGPAERFGAIAAKRRNGVASQTLGQVVKSLTESYVVPQSKESEVLEEQESESNSCGPLFRISHQLKMEDSAYEEVSSMLGELVTLRNSLVHHFLENHDIWTESGCCCASDYLDACYKQIDTALEQLRSFAESIIDGRKSVATLLQSEEFRDKFINGAESPKQDVTPTNLGVVVLLLQDAEIAHAADGWTNLQDAITHMRKHGPEHTPKQYGFSSWRELLQVSGKFDIRRDTGLPECPRPTWYRSRAKT